MKKIIILLCVVVAIFSACQKDYLIDGGVANPNVNMTTYDYLKSNPLFDTLVILIDKAGLKDQVNGAVTFMAPTDYSILNYLNDVTADLRVNDPLAKYGLDNIPAETLKQLGSYMIDGKLTRDKLAKEGNEYTTKDGEKRKISLEPRDEYKDYLAEKPQFIFFYKKVGVRWDDFGETGLGNDELDKVVRVRTSGIISTTGVIHVLQGDHVLFFYERIYK